MDDAKEDDKLTGSDVDLGSVQAGDDESDVDEDWGLE